MNKKRTRCQSMSELRVRGGEVNRLYCASLKTPRLRFEWDEWNGTQNVSGCNSLSTWHGKSEAFEI